MRRSQLEGTGGKKEWANLELVREGPMVAFLKLNWGNYVVLMVLQYCHKSIFRAFFGQSI
jgi:hypothetical protein